MERRKRGTGREGEEEDGEESEMFVNKVPGSNYVNFHRGKGFDFKRERI